MNYLKEKKHRKIAHICGNPNKKVTIERFNGYIQAMQEADLEVKDGYIQYSSADYRSGYDRMNALLDLEERPTAVFVLMMRSPVMLYGRHLTEAGGSGDI